MTKHRAIPKGYMTVGEVAKKIGVTVRTLQLRKSQLMAGQNKERSCA